MRSVQDIRTSLAEHKQNLFLKYPIKSMAIFGSYSRDEQNEKSDLDLLVDFSDKIGIQFIDLAEELETMLGIKVDLISKGAIQEKYYQAIQSDLIYV